MNWPKFEVPIFIATNNTTVSFQSLCSRCPPPRCTQMARRLVKFAITLFNTSPSICLVSLSTFLLSSWIVWGFVEYTRPFRWPHKKKSGGVRSGEWGAHSIAHLRLITLSPKRSCIQCRAHAAVCGVAPSCWNHCLFFGSLFRFSSRQNVSSTCR